MPWILPMWQWNVRQDTMRMKQKETLAKYETKTTETDTQDLPNIIVIMDEAFSDLKVLESLETNEDYMPFMHRMQQGGEKHGHGICPDICVWGKHCGFGI